MKEQARERLNQIIGNFTDTLRVWETVVSPSEIPASFSDLAAMNTFLVQQELRSQQVSVLSQNVLDFLVSSEREQIEEKISELKWSLAASAAEIARSADAPFSLEENLQNIWDLYQNVIERVSKSELNEATKSRFASEATDHALTEAQAILVESGNQRLLLTLQLLAQFKQTGDVNISLLAVIKSLELPPFIELKFEPVPVTPAAQKESEPLKSQIIERLMVTEEVEERPEELVNADYQEFADRLTRLLLSSDYSGFETAVALEFIQLHIGCSTAGKLKPFSILEAAQSIIGSSDPIALVPVIAALKKMVAAINGDIDSKFYFSGSLERLELTNKLGVPFIELTTFLEIDHKFFDRRTKTLSKAEATARWLQYRSAYAFDLENLDQDQLIESLRQICSEDGKKQTLKPLIESMSMFDKDKKRIFKPVAQADLVNGGVMRSESSIHKAMIRIEQLIAKHKLPLRICRTADNPLINQIYLVMLPDTSRRWTEMEIDQASGLLDDLVLKVSPTEFDPIRHGALPSEYTTQEGFKISKGDELELHLVSASPEELSDGMEEISFEPSHVDTQPIEAVPGVKFSFDQMAKIFLNAIGNINNPDYREAIELSLDRSVNQIAEEKGVKRTLISQRITRANNELLKLPEVQSMGLSRYQLKRLAFIISEDHREALDETRNGFQDWLRTTIAGNWTNQLIAQLNSESQEGTVQDLTIGANSEDLRHIFAALGLLSKRTYDSVTLHVENAMFGTVLNILDSNGAVLNKFILSDSRGQRLDLPSIMPGGKLLTASRINAFIKLFEGMPVDLQESLSNRLLYPMRQNDRQVAGLLQLPQLNGEDLQAVVPLSYPYREVSIRLLSLDIVAQTFDMELFHQNDDGSEDSHFRLTREGSQLKVIMEKTGDVRRRTKRKYSYNLIDYIEGTTDQLPQSEPTRVKGKHILINGSQYLSYYFASNRVVRIRLTRSAPKEGIFKPFEMNGREYVGFWDAAHPNEPWPIKYFDHLNNWKVRQIESPEA